MAEPGAGHLSIGEVLGLLLEEFPDVTISKIRFLESQGLIEPERTPSGYRKFFDDDVELLRVILREQREKFLPLRVIKDRIESGQIETADPTPPRGCRRPDAGADRSSSRAGRRRGRAPGAPAAPAASRDRRGAAERRRRRPAGAAPAPGRAGQPRRAVRDGVGHPRPAGPARGLRRRRRSAARATSTARTPSRSPPRPAGSCGPASTPATCGPGGRRSSARPACTSSSSCPCCASATRRPGASGRPARRARRRSAPACGRR